jgi:hypothetical protein
MYANVPNPGPLIDRAELLIFGNDQRPRVAGGPAGADVNVRHPGWGVLSCRSNMCASPMVTSRFLYGCGCPGTLCATLEALWSLTARSHKRQGLGKGAPVMNDTSHFLGLSAEDITELETATQLRIADEPRWSGRDYDRVIAYLRAKAATRTSPKLPPKCAGPK